MIVNFRCMSRRVFDMAAKHSTCCLWACAMLLCASHTCFSQDSDDASAYGDAVVVGALGEPSVLIPLLASDGPSHDVGSMLYNGLVKYDTDLTLVGDLAESWDISPDGQIITFHLRTGVVWEDGVPFTAHDVLYGFSVITDPATPTAYAEDFRQVLKAEVLDAHTFRVTYANPFAPALGTWGSLPVLPRHLLEGQALTQSTLTRNPVGLGPFRFNKWIPGQNLILEANPLYFDGRPRLDRYIYRFIPDSSTMFMELQAGKLDLMSLTPLQYIRQTNNEFFKNNFQKFKYPTFSYTYLAFNFLHPWFQDRRIRRAIAHAIDKQEIIDGVLLGLGHIATGPYVPDTWPYNPGVVSHAYNPEMSRDLLSQAGWNDTDGDGILDKDGEAFEFTILTNMGNAMRIKAATIIQWRLGLIGIKVNIRMVEWATFINEFVDTRRFQALILGWSIGLDPDQYDIWHSSKSGEKELNFISYRNPEVDLLLEQGRRTFDREARMKAYFRVQEILADEVPYVFLYVPFALPIVHARIKNIDPSPIGIHYNINQWYVPKHAQKHALKP